MKGAIYRSSGKRGIIQIETQIFRRERTTPEMVTIWINTKYYGHWGGRMLW